MASSQGGARRGLLWAVAILILVLPGAFGSISSALATLFALALLPWLFSRDALAMVVQQPAAAVFAAVFALLLLVFTITAREPADVLFVANFLALLVAPAVYVALVPEPRSPGLPLLLVALCTVGACVTGIVAVNDLVLRGESRSMGIAMGINLVPRFALTLGFVGLAGLFLSTSKWRLLFYAGPLASIVTTFLTASRGGAVAIPLLFGLALLFIGLHRSTRRHLLFAAGALVVLLAVVLVSPGRLAQLPAIVTDLVSAGVSADASTNERMAMLSAGARAFIDAPWIGYGWGNLAEAAAAHGLGVDADDRFFQFHNDLVNFAVAGGIVGIICWLLLLAAPLLGTLTMARDSLAGARLYCCLVLTLGYAVFGLTDMTIGYDLTTTLYCFLTVAILALFRREPSPPPAP